MLICIRLVGRNQTRNRSANSAHNESSSEPTTAPFSNTGYLRRSPSPIGGSKRPGESRRKLPTNSANLVRFCLRFGENKWTCFIFEHVARKLRSAHANYLLENACPVTTTGRFLFTTYLVQMVASLQVRSLTLQVLLVL